MRLNPDCIRDILLYIEENTNSKKPYIVFKTICLALDYDADTIDYHIRKLDSANLFDDVAYGNNTISCISSLSWEGHSYIDNIRDPKVWKSIKKSTGKFASISMPILVQLAANHITKLLPFN